jgi:hypothetical protein
MAPALRAANGQWSMANGQWRMGGGQSVPAIRHLPPGKVSRASQRLVASRPLSAPPPKLCASTVLLTRSCLRARPGAVPSISSSRRRLGAKRASGTRPGPMQAATGSLCGHEGRRAPPHRGCNACPFRCNAPASACWQAGAMARRPVGFLTAPRTSGGAHVERELARSCMGPGLVPLVPFGHARRRDDDRGVQPLRAAVPVRKAGGVHSVGAAAQTCLAICPIPPTPTAAPCA